MTSTVLDVTVMLLCVSASVVALGAVDGGAAASSPETVEVADLIATETVTVTYASSEGPNGTQTIHATRAELLALLAAGEGRSDGTAASAKAFESAVKRAVRHGTGRRTRIDAKVVTKTPRESATKLADRSKEPPERSSVGSTGLIADRFEYETEPTDETRVPWRVYREPRGGRHQDDRKAATASDRLGPVTVGSEPPRGVAVAAAVITHPLPGGNDGEKRVKIIVRRW